MVEKGKYIYFRKGHIWAIFIAAILIISLGTTSIGKREAENTRKNSTLKIFLI